MLSAALRARDAAVTGLDASAGMLGLAEERLGDDVELRVADLNGPLPFRAGAFGDVIASLVLSTGRRCPRGAEWRPGGGGGAPAPPGGAEE